jgi:hypothetical protein
MKNILILADGLVAREFIRQINNKRISDNRYMVVIPRNLGLPEKIQVQMEAVRIDPTSYSKIRHLFNQNEFTVVFILLDSLEETGESLKNIRRIDEKIRVVLLDQWNGFRKLTQSNTVVVNSNEMLSNLFYNLLPGVPVVARNVGLGEGEIMEVLVPFGSTFAYRHVGSISQVKWKIAAIYRDHKMILPTNASMIRPQDTLLLIGKPQVLSNIFYRIQERAGLFPEPFGRNLYLVLDMDRDQELALNYLRESIYLREKLEDRDLIVRILNPGNFALIDKIKTFETRRVDIRIAYDIDDPVSLIVTDMQKYDTGLVFLSRETFRDEKIYKGIFDLKKLVYLFGATPLYNITRSIVLMTKEEEMEAISSTSFYISETLDLSLCLCHYDPEGDFESGRRSIEHYETLSHIFHFPIQIEEKQVNPVRALKEMKNILQIAPFGRNLRKRWWLPFLSTNVDDYLLEVVHHPKLLIPVEMG